MLNRDGFRLIGIAATVSLALAGFAQAGEIVSVRPTGDDDLDDTIRNASLLLGSERDDRTDAQSLFAAARADYGRIITALYGEGYYAPVIHILVDGREAADIAPLDAPRTIRAVSVSVDPGPRFTFGRIGVAPLAEGTRLPDGFATGKPAKSGLIVESAKVGVDGWRDTGHAKASVATQDIVADHPSRRLDATVALAPGPVVVFGQLLMSGYDRITPRRLAKIAGLPSGTVFNPKVLETVRKRLRRTGVFSSISLQEAETLGPDNSMDITLSVVEQKPRRIGFGAEYSTDAGGMVSGYWIHRNLLGGAERLRLDGRVSNIGQGSALDYGLDLRLDRPATLTADTAAFAEAGVSHTQGPDLKADLAYAGIGFSHVFSDTLTGDIALRYTYSRETDALGTTTYKLLSLPTSITWDKRDSSNDARHGFYLSGKITPFLGFSGTGSGAQLRGDARGYYSFGAEDRFTLAGRVQFGTLAGVSLTESPSDLRFWSGGGGTVRGQPYQSLGHAEVSGQSYRTGAASLATLTAELRMDITGSIGAAAFVDAGFVSDDGFWSGNSGSHAGAGLGLRYKTPIGPLRLDIAAPVSGDTGDGVQAYIGIGQAF